MDSPCTVLFNPGTHGGSDANSATSSSQRPPRNGSAATYDAESEMERMVGGEGGRLKRSGGVEGRRMEGGWREDGGKLSDPLTF